MTISKARKILGVVSTNYSDTEIKEIICLLRDIAELAYDEYLTSDQQNIEQPYSKN